MYVRSVTVLSALGVLVIGLLGFTQRRLSAIQAPDVLVESKQDSIQPNRLAVQKSSGHHGTNVYGGEDVHEIIRDFLSDMIKAAPVPPDRQIALSEFFEKHPELHFDGWGVGIRSVVETGGFALVTLDVSPLVSSATGAGSITVSGGVQETYITDGWGGIHLIDLKPHGPISVFVD